MSAAAVWDSPALLDPMHALKPAERTLLRKLDAHGPAVMAGIGKGWMLAGTRYSAKSLNRFLDLGLATFYKDGRDVKLRLNEAGGIAAYRLAPSSSSANAPSLPSR